MSAAIQYVIDTVLPDVERTPGIRREVSQRTKELYEKREKAKGLTQGEYDSLQKQIREARLDDFKDWVEAHGDKMQEANGHGDV